MMEQMRGNLNKSNSKNSFNTSLISVRKSSSSLSYYQDSKMNTNNSFDTERSYDEMEVSKLKEILKKKDSELSDKKNLLHSRKNEY